jgi:hypothetical protein
MSHMFRSKPEPKLKQLLCQWFVFFLYESDDMVSDLYCNLNQHEVYIYERWGKIWPEVHEMYCSLTQSWL